MAWPAFLTFWLRSAQATLARCFPGRGAVQRTDLHVILYTRVNCPLCDEAAQVLERYRARYGFSLETQDVDRSVDLVAEHGNWVPVVAVNGRIRFRGRVNAVLLQRIMDARGPAV